MEASNQKDTEPRASASGYLKVKQLVSNAAARIADIRLLTRTALFAYIYFAGAATITADLM